MKAKNVLKWQAAMVCALCVCVGLGGGALVDSYGGDEGQSAAGGSRYAAADGNIYDGATVGEGASGVSAAALAVGEGASGAVNVNAPAADDAAIASGAAAAALAVGEGVSGAVNVNAPAVDDAAIASGVSGAAALAVENGDGDKEIAGLQSGSAKKSAKESKGKSESKKSDKKSTKKSGKKDTKKSNKKSKKKSSAAKKYKTKVKATWYTGDVLGFRGSYGKLTNGNTIALNASQRSELGVGKKETVYLDFPGDHENLSGRYKVMDSGCSSGVVDLFYSSKGSVPKKFKRAGVVRGVKLYRYG
jgi:hypothetical protein